MREIEFRGKRIDDGEWAHGCGYMIDNATVGYPVYVYSDARFKHYKVHPETVGEYTGLKDRNGVKIFEGDIVSIKYYCNDREKSCEDIRVVNITLSSFGQLDLFGGFAQGQLHNPQLKVIGTIHDNPELLEAEK